MTKTAEEEASAGKVELRNSRAREKGKCGGVRGWDEFIEVEKRHSFIGRGRAWRGVRRKKPSLGQRRI